jgi:YHS domain-containing protein
MFDYCGEERAMKTFLFLTAFILMGFAVPAFAADKISTGFLSNQAVSGYDTVAYFTEGKPVKGSEDFKSDYEGAVWLFSSAANKAKFDENPLKYAPQYGGYCSWAVSQGSTASSDPTLWAIVDGKLYLNYSAKTKKQWDTDRPKYIAQADKNWPAVLN